MQTKTQKQRKTASPYTLSEWEQKTAIGFYHFCSAITDWIQSLYIKQFEDQQANAIQSDDANPIIDFVMKILWWAQNKNNPANTVYFDWANKDDHHQAARGKNIWTGSFQYSDNQAPVLDWAEQNARERFIASRGR